jgi:hypothetical protein
MAWRMEVPHELGPGSLPRVALAVLGDGREGAPRCGARIRRQTACQCPAVRNRCRLHGESTEPNTAGRIAVFQPPLFMRCIGHFGDLLEARERMRKTSETGALAHRNRVEFRTLGAQARALGSVAPILQGASSLGLII